MSNSIEPIASTEARLKAGERRFSKLEARIEKSDAEVKDHLRSQDENIASIAAQVGQIGANTQAIIAMWDDGARTIRFFCRLAQGWRFLLKSVVLPVCIPVAVIYAVIYYAEHGHFPEWTGAALKLFVG
jgi:hypothetical protein